LPGALAGPAGRPKSPSPTGAGAVCTGLGAGGVLGVAKFEAFHA